MSTKRRLITTNGRCYVVCVNRVTEANARMLTLKDDGVVQKVWMITRNGPGSGCWHDQDGRRYRSIDEAATKMAEV